MLNRLLRKRIRLVAGVALLVAAVVALVIAYTSIANEVYVSIQLPWVLGGGVGALLCAGVGLVLLRAQGDTENQSRLAALNTAHEAMTDRFEALGERVEYLTQLLEAALVTDGDGTATRSVANEVRV
jgi:hypothetical protein